MVQVWPHPDDHADLVVCVTLHGELRRAGGRRGCLGLILKVVLGGVDRATWRLLEVLVREAAVLGVAGSGWRIGLCLGILVVLTQWSQSLRVRELMHYLIY